LIRSNLTIILYRFFVFGFNVKPRLFTLAWCLLGIMQAFPFKLSWQPLSESLGCWSTEHHLNSSDARAITPRTHASLLTIPFSPRDQMRNGMEQLCTPPSPDFSPHSAAYLGIISREALPSRRALSKLHHRIPFRLVQLRRRHMAPGITKAVPPPSHSPGRHRRCRRQFVLQAAPGSWSPACAGKPGEESAKVRVRSVSALAALHGHFWG